MTNNNFYTIAAAMIRENKNCKYEAGRKCIPISTDTECNICIAEKKELIKEMAK